jgi:hypothetical protein
VPQRELVPCLCCGIRATGGTVCPFWLFAPRSRGCPRRARLFSKAGRESLHIQSHYLLYMKKPKKSNPAPLFHGNDAFFRFRLPKVPRNAKK